MTNYTIPGVNAYHWSNGAVGKSGDNHSSDRGFKSNLHQLVAILTYNFL